MLKKADKNYGCCKELKRKFVLPEIRLICREDKEISNIGIVTGSGIDVLFEEDHKDIELFITGDVKYHQAQDILHGNKAVIDAGHFGTEQIFPKAFLSLVQEILGVNMILSDVNAKSVSLYRIRVIMKTLMKLIKDIPFFKRVKDRYEAEKSVPELEEIRKRQRDLEEEECGIRLSIDTLRDQLKEQEMQLADVDRQIMSKVGGIYRSVEICQKSHFTKTGRRFEGFKKMR